MSHSELLMIAHCSPPETLAAGSSGLLTRARPDWTSPCQRLLWHLAPPGCQVVPRGIITKHHGALPSARAPLIGTAGGWHLSRVGRVSALQRYLKDLNVGQVYFDLYFIECKYYDYIILLWVYADFDDNCVKDSGLIVGLAAVLTLFSIHFASYLMNKIWVFIENVSFSGRFPTFEW